MPSLLVRAGQEILPGMGYILTAADAQRFVSEVPQSKLVEIDSNHYAIGMHPETARAIGDFLSALPSNGSRNSRSASHISSKSRSISSSEQTAAVRGSIIN